MPTNPFVSYPTPQTNYQQSYRPPAPTMPTQNRGGMSGLTPGANGTFTTPNPFGQTSGHSAQDYLDALKGQPLPVDLTSYYNQMLQQYQQMLGTQSGNYSQMLGLQNQLNQLMSVDPGAAYQQQMLEMNRPVQQRNTVDLYVGY